MAGTINNAELADFCQELAVPADSVRSARFIQVALAAAAEALRVCFTQPHKSHEFTLPHLWVDMRGKTFQHKETSVDVHFPYKPHTKPCDPSYVDPTTHLHNGNLIPAIVSGWSLSIVNVRQVYQCRMLIGTLRQRRTGTGREWLLGQA